MNSYTTKFMEWLSVFGPKLLGALIVFIVGLYLCNLVARLVSKGLSKRKIDVSLQSFLGSLVNGALKVLLLISVAGMLGIQTTSFVAVIGALGLAVGLALQGSLVLRYSPAAVAAAFCASRLTPDGGRAFGTLPAEVDCVAIIDRAWAP